MSKSAAQKQLIEELDFFKTGKKLNDKGVLPVWLENTLGFFILASAFFVNIDFLYPKDNFYNKPTINVINDPNTQQALNSKELQVFNSKVFELLYTTKPQDTETLKSYFTPQGYALVQKHNELNKSNSQMPQKVEFQSLGDGPMIEGSISNEPTYTLQQKAKVIFHYPNQQLSKEINIVSTLVGTNPKVSEFYIYNNN